MWPKQMPPGFLECRTWSYQLAWRSWRRRRRGDLHQIKRKGWALTGHHRRHQHRWASHTGVSSTRIQCLFDFCNVAWTSWVFDSILICTSNYICDLGTLINPLKRVYLKCDCALYLPNLGHHVICFLRHEWFYLMDLMEWWTALVRIR